MTIKVSVENKTVEALRRIYPLIPADAPAKVLVQYALNELVQSWFTGTVKKEDAKRTRS